jgi:hypothetical protein
VIEKYIKILKSSHTAGCNTTGMGMNHERPQNIHEYTPKEPGSHMDHRDSHPSWGPLQVTAKSFIARREHHLKAF